MVLKTVETEMVRDAAIPSAVSEKDRLRGVITVNKPVPEVVSNSSETHNNSANNMAGKKTKKRVALTSVSQHGQNVAEGSVTSSDPKSKSVGRIPFPQEQLQVKHLSTLATVRKDLARSAQMILLSGRQK